MEKNKEESEFYKKKNKELDERNQHLIKINEELREKIDGVLKLKQSSSTNSFFKEQNERLQSDI